MRIAQASCGIALAGLIGLAGMSETVMADHHGSDHGSSKQGAPSIVDIATTNDNFETLTKALKTAELVGALQDRGPFTVFAPTDAAFGKLNQRSLAATLEPRNRDRLTSILTYHVVPGRFTLSELAQRQFVTTLDGERVRIDFSGELKLNDSRVVASDIEASNGIIHAIDAVLIPEKQSIAKVADNAGFKTLVAAAGKAGLVDALNGNDDLTVFAPTDEAFAKLGEEKIAELLKPENRETLATILKYHVVAGRAYASDVIGGASPETLAGETVTIESAAKGLSVNGVSIVKTDVNASNGVIHVIDEVLIPPSLTESRKSANKSAGKSDGETRVPDISPAQVVELAIAKGAPLFNDGQQEACAAIYEVAATSLLAWNGLNAEAENALGRGLWRIKDKHSPQERAWILREALDDAYEALTERRPQAGRHH